MRTVPLSLLLLVLWLPAPAVAAENRLEEVAGRQPAPPLDLVDLQGRRHRLSDYRGSVVLVNFWASWCPECVYEMPSLSRVWAQLRGRGLVLLAVDVNEEERAVRDYVRDNGLAFPVLLDPKMTAYKAWPVIGVPASYLVDADGRVRYQAVGARDWDRPEMLAVVERLLEEAAR